MADTVDVGAFPRSKLIAVSFLMTPSSETLLEGQSGFNRDYVQAHHPASTAGKGTNGVVNWVAQQFLHQVVEDGPPTGLCEQTVT